MDFKLPVFKPNFYRYYLHFENFISILKRCKLADGKNFSEVCELIKFKAKECFRNHASHKVFSPMIEKEDLDILKNLGEDQSIKICKPDKGRGSVLLNTLDYQSKMISIISDITKFEKVNTDHFSLTLKIEDKVNRFLAKLKKIGVIGEIILFIRNFM